MATLSVFTKDQLQHLHRLLAIKVAYMLGRKMEENDWGDIYCKAKGIPNQGWSNLNIDVAYDNLGVEHKMLRVKSSKVITDYCGQSLMHPSATRSVRIASLTADPNVVMGEVFEQYAALLEARKTWVQERSQTSEPIDLRTGWLLWQENLNQFLYFEEQTIAPQVEDYYAVWEEGKAKGKGARKSSTNLWVYERSTDKKRYSITTSAGIKIQPYFDIPSPQDPNLYVFTVIGEAIDFGQVRVWLTQSTLRDLQQLFGTLDKDDLSTGIITLCATITGSGADIKLYEQNGDCVVVTVEAYQKLYETFPNAISDEHAFLMLVDNNPKGS
jgi:hypothetical protein